MDPEILRFVQNFGKKTKINLVVYLRASYNCRVAVRKRKSRRAASEIFRLRIPERNEDLSSAI
jgi:hypothetical protein